MSEFERQVAVFKKSYMCDKEDCRGEMLPTGNTGMEDKKEVFQHRCTICDTPQVFSVKYPIFDYI